MVRRLERALKSSENGRKVKMTTLTRTDLVAAAAAAGFQLNLSNMEKKGKFPTSTSACTTITWWIYRVRGIVEKRNIISETK